MNDFNKVLVKIEGSNSINYMQKAKELEENNIEVIDLAGGEPDFDTPSKIKDVAIQSLLQGHTHYTVGKGNRALRRAIVDKLNRENGISCAEEQVIVTPGAKYAVYMAISAVVNPGDEVIILSPHWVSYAPIVQIAGATPVFVQLDYQNDYEIDKNKIEEKITPKTRMIITNYPNNPTGKIMTYREAIIIKEIIEKYNLYVLADEIYEKIVYDGQKNFSLASIPEIKDNVITINGFSKCVAMTGWRIGYVIANQSLIDIMYKLFVHTITGVNTFVQEAALSAFDCENEMEEMLKIYKERRDFFADEINKIPGFSCKKPQGGFYLWIRVDTQSSSYSVCEKLIDEMHLLSVPGDSYGENNAVYIRCCFAKDIEILKKAIKHLKKFDLGKLAIS